MYISNLNEVFCTAGLPLFVSDSVSYICNGNFIPSNSDENSV